MHDIYKLIEYCKYDSSAKYDLITKTNYTKLP